MASPSSHDIDVALGALRADATVWQSAAGSAQQAQSAAAAISLSAGQFSYLADKAGVTKTYDQLQQRVAELLAGAAANFTNVSQTLTAVRGTYEANEQKTAGSFSSLRH
jgi:hypothetical protein